jgi:hypothetical protein
LKPPLIQSRKPQPKDTIVAVEGSKAPTIATTEDDNAIEVDFATAFADNFNGINWLRLPKYMRPLGMQKQKKS